MYFLTRRKGVKRSPKVEILNVKHGVFYLQKNQ